MEIYAKGEGQGSVGHANTLNNLGLAYDNKNNYNMAIKCYREALEIYEQEEGSASHANTLNNLGIAYKNKNNYDMFIKCYREALEIYAKGEGQGSVGHAQIFNNLGNA